LKWHGLQRKQLKIYWEFCKAKLNDAENERFKSLMEAMVIYFSKAVKLARKLSVVELGVRNMEEMIRAFGSSLAILPSETQSVATISNQQPIKGRGSMEQQRSAVDAATNSLNPLAVVNCCHAVVKDIQEIRGAANEMNQIIECFGNLSPQEK